MYERKTLDNLCDTFCYNDFSRFLLLIAVFSKVLMPKKMKKKKIEK